MNAIYISFAALFALVIACGNPPNNEKKTGFGKDALATSGSPSSTPSGGTTGGTTAGTTTGGTNGGTTTGGTTSGTTPSPTGPATGLTYTKDVKPIMVSKSCEGCHSQYNNYAGVKAGIASILSRVNNDNMPKNNTPLTAAQKKTLADWAATPGMPN